MTGFLLDTNVPSELTRRQSDASVEKWLDDANDEELFLSVVSLGEFLKGLTVLPHGKRREQVHLWIDETLRPWFAGRILPVTEAIAERWGVLTGQSQLQGQGAEGRGWTNRGYCSGARSHPCDAERKGLRRAARSHSRSLADRPVGPPTARRPGRRSSPPSLPVAGPPRNTALGAAPLSAVARRSPPCPPGRAWSSPATRR